jgi:hypothetical protein
MTSISTSVEIARRPEDVFAYLSDVSRHPEWQDGLVSATVATGGPVGVGSRIVHRRKLGPLARRQAMRQVTGSHQELKRILESSSA